MSASQRLQGLLAKNAKYAETYTPPPPLATIRAKGNILDGGSIVIISCSDPRVVPQEYFNLSNGEAGKPAIIRNAGGRAVDALRSLLVLDALVRIGTVIVVHHTDCGATHVLDDEVRKGLKARRPEMSDAIEEMRFGEITDMEKSVRDDIALLKAEPLLSDDTHVIGYVLDLQTGLLNEVKS